MGRAVLSKNSIGCLLMSTATVPPCQTLGGGDPASSLQAPQQGFNGSLQRGPGTGHLLRLLLPRRSPPQEPSITAGRSGPVPGGVTAPFCWALVHTRLLFVPSKSRVFGSPRHVEKSYNQTLLAFKVRFLGDTWSLCWTAKLRSLTWSSKSSQQWGASWVLLSSTLWVTHPAGIGFDFVRIMPFLHLVWLPLCLWMWCIFFGGFQHPPVNSCSTASCDFQFNFINNGKPSFYNKLNIFHHWC